MGKLEPGERKPQAARGLQGAKVSIGRGKRRPFSTASHRYRYKRAMNSMDNFMQICFTLGKAHVIMKTDLMCLAKSI